MDKKVRAIAREALDRALHHVMRADTAFRESDTENDADVRGDIHDAEDAVRLARRRLTEKEGGF